VTPRTFTFDGSLPAYRRRVALLKDAQPGEPWSVEGERSAEEEDAAAGRPAEAFFAEMGGDIVGFARCRADPEGGSPGRRRLWVAVAHGARRRGAGSALLAAVLQAAAAGGATGFLVTTSLAEPHGLAFALRHGFSEVEGEVELHLDLHAFSATRPAARPHPPGLHLVDLASLALSAPNWRERYYALYTSLATGIMWASNAPAPEREDFRRFHVEAPGFLAEGSVVAVLGDEWVGLGELWCSGSDHHTAYQELTGVLPVHRRRGIGSAVVEAVAARAAALGFGRLLTSTNRDNRAMRVVAARLGFVEAAGWSYLVAPVARVPSGQEVGP
jgi:GNAT superfamily N-acetyltransferase